MQMRHLVYGISRGITVCCDSGIQVVDVCTIQAAAYEDTHNPVAGLSSRYVLPAQDHHHHILPGPRTDMQSVFSWFSHQTFERRVRDES